MPRIQYPGFCGPSYIAQSPVSDCEDLINMLVESNRAPNAASQFSLLPTPGANLLSTAVTVGTRASISMGGFCFAVIGNTFYQVNSDFTLTARGTVAVNANPATISYGGDGSSQFFTTSGGNAYVWDTSTSTFSQVHTLDGLADQGGFLDGFFLAFCRATGQMFMSSPDNATVWDLTNEWQRSSAADPWRAFIVTPRRQILMFGEYTSELWGNTGASPIPFELIGGATVKQGTGAYYSARAVGESVVWLAQNEDGIRTVQQMRGYTAYQISTAPLEYALQQYARTDDAEPFVYELEGHQHWVLNLPNANHSWGFDATESFWNKRGTWNTLAGDFDVWHAQSHVVFGGKHLAFDRFTGGIYELGTRFGYDFGGAAIRRVRIPPPLPSKRQLITRSRLEIYGEPGLADISGQGSDPRIFLRSSKNGGKTWNAERYRSFGKMGQYDKPVIFGTMPAGRRCVDELVMTDPIPWRITDAYITLNQGLS